MSTLPIMLNSCNSQASTTKDAYKITHEDPLEVFNDLQTIIAEGFRLHAQFNFSTSEGRLACIANNSYLADETKLLQKRVDRVDADHHAQRDLFLAANKAMNCVYCGGDPMACGQASEHMNKARQLLAANN